MIGATWSLNCFCFDFHISAEQFEFDDRNKQYHVKWWLKYRNNRSVSWRLSCTLSYCVKKNRLLLFFVLVHNLTFKSCRCTQKWYIVSLVTLKYLLNWFKLVELKYVQLSKLFKVPIFYLYVPIPPMQKHIGRKGQKLHWKLCQ